MSVRAYCRSQHLLTKERKNEPSGESRLTGIIPLKRQILTGAIWADQDPITYQYEGRIKNGNAEQLSATP
jgi:hypothetical protein